MTRNSAAAFVTASCLAMEQRSEAVQPKDSSGEWDLEVSCVAGLSDSYVSCGLDVETCVKFWLSSVGTVFFMLQEFVSNFYENYSVIRNFKIRTVVHEEMRPKKGPNYLLFLTFQSSFCHLIMQLIRILSQHEHFKLLRFQRYSQWLDSVFYLKIQWGPTTGVFKFLIGRKRGSLYWRYSWHDSCYISPHFPTLLITKNSQFKV